MPPMNSRASELSFGRTPLTTPVARVARCKRGEPVSVARPWPRAKARGNKAGGDKALVEKARGDVGTAPPLDGVQPVCGSREGAAALSRALQVRQCVCPSSIADRADRRGWGCTHRQVRRVSHGDGDVGMGAGMTTCTMCGSHCMTSLLSLHTSARSS
jgi:hypothetical protein